MSKKKDFPRGDIGQLCKEAVRNGAEVRRDGGHFKVFYEGRMVAVVTSSSREKSRNVKNTRAHLRRAGLVA